MNTFAALKELSAAAFDARVEEPVLVIESDDWGMSGVPSRDVYDELVSAGVFPAAIPWYRDALESPEDLDRLYAVLCGVRDHTGRPAQLTANFIMSNPDAGRLLSGGAAAECFITLPELCERDGQAGRLRAKWAEGVELGVLRPEYHGLYHLDVDELDRALRHRDERVTKILRAGARPAGMTDGVDRRFLSEHLQRGRRRDGAEDRQRQLAIVKRGTEAFRRLFGRAPAAVVAPHCLWNDDTEWAWSECEIRYVQWARRRPDARRLRTLARPGAFRMGAPGGYGLTYLDRNCRFEPSVFPEDTAERALRQVESAFETERPAVISMHRINISGAVDPRARDRSLALLESVLCAVVARYPNVRFLNSAELGGLLTEGGRRVGLSAGVRRVLRRLGLGLRRRWSS